MPEKRNPRPEDVKELSGNIRLRRREGNMKKLQETPMVRDTTELGKAFMGSTIGPKAIPLADDVGYLREIAGTVTPEVLDKILRKPETIPGSLRTWLESINALGPKAGNLQARTENVLAGVGQMEQQGLEDLVQQLSTYFTKARFDPSR